jgi:hypothetical protein
LAGGTEDALKIAIMDSYSQWDKKYFPDIQKLRRIAMLCNAPLTEQNIEN